MGQKFYLTTPIYYVNDIPHIGHTCTTLIADIIARYHRLLGHEVFFLTGTDEHGAKIAEAAAKEGLSPQEFCDKVSKSFLEIWPKLDIEYDFFIRTTNKEHERIVQEIVEKIYKKGDIYKAKYEGFYCVGCEKFINETDLIDGKCPLHPNRPIEKQTEENWFFKLSKYVPILIEAIENPKHPFHYEIQPENRKEEVLTRLKSGVKDLSISRAEVSWGVPVPWDKNQTIYVWVDALFNYYTAPKIAQKEEFWPADLHLIAKDILWFHAVIWEALLISANLPLPKKIFAHNFFTINGQKMSKSLGNVISPQDLIDNFGVDGARYLVASFFPVLDDSDIGIEKFKVKYNADLANGLGNLVSRISSLIQKEKIHFFPVKKLNFDLEVQKNIENFNFSEALNFIWQKIDSLNKKINELKLWEKSRNELEKLILPFIEEIRSIAFQLQPFMPKTAEKILQLFKGPEISTTVILFPRKR